MYFSVYVPFPPPQKKEKNTWMVHIYHQSNFKGDVQYKKLFQFCRHNFKYSVLLFFKHTPTCWNMNNLLFRKEIFYRCRYQQVFVGDISSVYSIFDGLEKGTFSVMRHSWKCKNSSDIKVSSALISKQRFIQNTINRQLSRGYLGRGTKKERTKVNLTIFKNVAWYSTSIHDPKNYPP